MTMRPALRPPMLAPMRPPLNPIKGAEWWLSGSQLDLDFANDRAFNRSTGFNGSPNSLLTYTSPSPKMVYGDDGVLFQSSGNLPYDYDPITHEPLGVLIEEQRTNLLTYAEQFDNPAWTKYNVGVTNNAAIAPDGTSTADKLTESATTSTHTISQSPTVVSGTTYTVSVYLKAAELGFALLALSTTGFGFTGVTVNLTTGEVSTGTGSPLNAFTTAVGDGWWRVGFSLAATSSASGQLLVYTSHDGVFANRSHLGIDGSGIYVWGAQLEAGAFPTSYIPTVASQVTRAADNVYELTSSFAYNTLEGTVLADLPNDARRTGNLMSLSNGTTAVRTLVLYHNTTTSIWMYSSGSPGTLGSIGTISSAAYKVAAAYKLNNYGASLNGGAPITDTSAVVDVPNRLNVGNGGNGLVQLNGHIKRLTYWNTRKTNAELQELSA